MMRRTPISLRQERVYYNLSYKGDGRMMTGFATPYRVWMWKQQEIWRQVHEDQFEHYRNMYKRQWLEAFRSNADEYIYKYNITKAHTLREWEAEMEDQELKRVQEVQKAGARSQLKKKHLDILREYHERHFFHWYERASERLQYFSKMNWVQRSDLEDHIEAELNKYVRGKDEAYPLNFVGQMPMIEDEDGTVVEVPESMMHMHQAQLGDKMPATMYEPPQTLDADAILREQISAGEADLDMLSDEERKAMEDIVDMESKIGKPIKAHRSEDKTMKELDAEKSADMARHGGKVGSRAAAKAQRHKTAQHHEFTITPEEVAGDAKAAKGKKAPKADKKAPHTKKPKESQDGFAKHQKVTEQVKIGEMAKTGGKIDISSAAFEAADDMVRSGAFGDVKGPKMGGGGASKKSGDDDDEQTRY